MFRQSLNILLYWAAQLWIPSIHCFIELSSCDYPQYTALLSCPIVIALTPHVFLPFNLMINWIFNVTILIELRKLQDWIIT
jgi:hypothetical protein